MKKLKAGAAVKGSMAGAIGEAAGAAITREELKRLTNTTLKERSGAAVTTPELERLKKEADSRFIGSKRRQELGNSIKKQLTQIESSISKNKDEVPGVGVGSSEPEKKSKGGFIIGKGGDYIKDLL
jgi:hypothetical protein